MRRSVMFKDKGTGPKFDRYADIKFRNPYQQVPRPPSPFLGVSASSLCHALISEICPKRPSRPKINKKSTFMREIGPNFEFWLLFNELIVH